MTNTAKTIERKLSLLLKEGDAQKIEGLLEALRPIEMSLAISRLDEEERASLFRVLDAEDAANVLKDLPMEQAADVLEEVEPRDAAEIVTHLRDDKQVDLLHDIDEEERDAIVEAMPGPDAARARSLLHYADDTAGGLMTQDVLSFPVTATVGRVLEDLRAHRNVYSDFEVQYAYIVDAKHKLVGVLRMRDLLLSPEDFPVRNIMIPEPISVPDSMKLDELLSFCQEHEFIGIPVVDGEERLLGVLRRSDVLAAGRSSEKNQFLKVSGIVGGEEFRSMKWWLRSTRRLSWLAPNIVLNLVAASVIAFFEGTLQSVIALAVFLPIISDMSGCSGNQAAAVSIRELALGLLRPGEFVRVFTKEVWVGVLNGIVLGCLLGAVAALWKSNFYLGLVVGGALALNTLLSVLLGGSIPLFLKRFGVDPALASGPMLTTVTDLCGFLFVLSFATRMLPYLQG